jgi:sugar lactone lactonase YvrE
MKNLLLSEVSVFRRANSIIAESIWWDGTHSLRWCDIDTGTIYSSSLDGSVEGEGDRTLVLPAPVGAFQPTAHPHELVFAGADYVAIANEDGARVDRIAEFDHHSERMRFNEAKCDPAGRFVVGSMNLEGNPDGAIYSVDEHGEVLTLIGGIGVANGFEWSDDGTTMWFTDTSSQTIYTGDYSSDGALTDVRTFVHGHRSDGLTRDADGGFWNGIYDSGSVIHWDADGTKDLELDVPAGHVTSVGFGGPTMSTLFIATARENLTEQQLRAEPLTGSIFQVETSTHGFPVRSFGTLQEGN